MPRGGEGVGGLGCSHPLTVRGVGWFRPALVVLASLAFRLLASLACAWFVDRSGDCSTRITKVSCFVGLRLLVGHIPSLVEEC